MIGSIECNITYQSLPFEIQDRREEEVDQEVVLVQKLFRLLIDLLAEAEERASTSCSAVLAIFNCPRIAPDEDRSIGREDAFVDLVTNLSRKLEERYDISALSNTSQMAG